MRAVVIASSTGGPQALNTIITALPGDFPAPILIVQHLPRPFIASLAERLNARSELEVGLAKPDRVARAGQVLIAGGAYHIAIEQDEDRKVVVRRDGSPPRESCRPSADVLFESAAEHFGPHVLGVVLTGMGRDGCDGSGAIRAAGGAVIAQDQDTSVIWGMPGAVVEAGYANLTLPLKQIASTLVQWTRNPVSRWT